MSQMVGTLTIITVTRLGDGSTTGWYVGTPMGLARLKNNRIICKFSGSYPAATTPGSTALLSLYGGIAGTPVSEFAQQPADLIGSMYLGSVGAAASRVRVKSFDTGGALFLRVRIVNRVSGTPIGVLKAVIGRTIAPV